MTQHFYWIGPYGIRVPNTISDVVAEDGYNIMDSSGSVTKMFKDLKSPTEEEYKEKYAKLGTDGYWYYTGP